MYKMFKMHSVDSNVQLNSFMIFCIMGSFAESLVLTLKTLCVKFSTFNRYCSMNSTCIDQIPKSKSVRSGNLGSHRTESLFLLMC